MAADLTDHELDRLIGLGDPDELLREIDRRCASQDWDGLVRLRDRCRLALGRGKQLWAPAAHAEYRLALEAPAPWAAAVLVDGTGRFSLGPLSEVAASTHTWAELRPHVEWGPAAAIAAQERIVRGEDLSGDPVAPLAGFDLPPWLAPWEPSYAVATYRAHEAEFPTPPVPTPGPVVELPAAGRRAHDSDSVDAFRHLTREWTTHSDGRADIAVVDGDGPAAIAALGPRRARLTDIEPSLALAWVAWTAASGGAHGRRRGAAAGRFDAWWLLAALGGLLEDWPPHPEVLGELAHELRWWWWDAAEPVTGWSLHLAVEDPVDGIAWAVAATDST